MGFDGECGQKARDPRGTVKDDLYWLLPARVNCKSTPELADDN